MTILRNSVLYGGIVMFHDGSLEKSCGNSRVEFCDRGPVKSCGWCHV